MAIAVEKKISNITVSSSDKLSVLHLSLLIMIIMEFVLKMRIWPIINVVHRIKFPFQQILAALCLFAYEV